MSTRWCYYPTKRQISVLGGSTPILLTVITLEGAEIPRYLKVPEKTKNIPMAQIPSIQQVRTFHTSRMSLIRTEVSKKEKVSRQTLPTWTKHINNKNTIIDQDEHHSMEKCKYD